MVAVTRRVAGLIRLTESAVRLAVHSEPKPAVIPSG
jgi:hypothetical protein